MKGYKSPRLTSYNCREITEIIGPAQNAAYLDVAGGRQAMLGSQGTEYVQECISPEIKLAQIDVKTKTIV